jgi:carnitine-CoA ligase
VADRVWAGAEQYTVPQLFARRLESDPDGEYLDIAGTKLSAGNVMAAGDRFGGVLDELGTAQHDRVASLLENSSPALLTWAGTVCAGRIAVPVNTAYKGAYLTHQLTDSGSRVLVVAASYLDRVATIAPDVPTLEHVIVVDDVDAGDGEGGGAPSSPVVVPALGRVAVHHWDDIMAASGGAPAVDVRPSDLATFIYTGGTTGLSKGCMLTHNYHEALARQIGLCWKRTADDVAWTPLPMYHFNALVTAIVGTLLFGGRAAIFRRFSVSQF